MVGEIMYEYRRRTGKFKRFFLIFLLMIFVSIASIFIYNMYVNIDVYSKENSSNSGAVRLSSVIKEDENQDISEVLDKTIKCVVGISKIKNTGNSIFLNNSTKELGLGTGIVITENRVYPYKFTCCRE